MVKLLCKAGVIFLLIFGPFLAAFDPKSGVPFALAAAVCWGLPAVLWLIVRKPKHSRSSVPHS